MSVTYTKLFSSITESTIWCESAETKVVWITLLARCDQYGRVFTSIPGLAKLAGVSLEATEAAINLFLEPDKYSRTKDHEGRRLCEIDGGFGLLNHDKYREMRDAADRKEYKRVWIANKRAAEKGELVDADVDKVDDSRPGSTHTDTDAKTDTKNKRFVLPENINTKAWQEFEDYRQSSAKLKKGWSDIARKKNAAVLVGMTMEQQQQSVDNSIKNGWSGLFEIKEQRNEKNTSASRQQAARDRTSQALVDAHAEEDAGTEDLQAV